MWKWKVMVFCAIAQTVSQIPSLNFYPLVSNAGELILIIGTTHLLYLAQQDLLMTAAFADFLHNSNAAFHQSPHYSHEEEDVDAASIELTNLESNGNQRSSSLSHDSNSNQHVNITNSHTI